MAIPIPDDVRELLQAPNYVHLSTLRADSSPRNWVVWAGLEGDHILVCTSDAIAKAKDMRRDPRVALSLTDIANPYRMAAIQGRVIAPVPRPVSGGLSATRHGEQNLAAGKEGPMRCVTSGRPGPSCSASRRPQAGVLTVTG